MNKLNHKTTSRKYDPELIKKLSLKTHSKEKSIREQISKRALKHNVSEEAELANWARSEKISASSYIKKLSPDIKAQIFSRPPSFSNDKGYAPVGLRIIRIGKDENKLYNQLWFQILVLGIAVSVISQVLGILATNLLGLTTP